MDTRLEREKPVLKGCYSANIHIQELEAKEKDRLVVVFVPDIVIMHGERRSCSLFLLLLLFMFVIYLFV